MSTAVPQIAFGPNGPIIPTEAAILAGVQQDLNAAFGTTLNPGLNTPQGQLATSETAIIGDNYAAFLWYCNQVDPALNSGRFQDAIGRIYFQQRIPGAPTVQPCLCTGLAGVVIPVGALAQDQNQALWICQVAGTIPTGGSITLDFANITDGPLPGPTGLTIYQTVFGWDSVTPSGDAVPGNLVESAAQFEARRAASVASNARAILDAIQGAVLALPGVLDAYCAENPKSSIVIVGGVALLAHSMYVCVLGGSSTAIATAIWTKKAPGCDYTGNTYVNVSDPSTAYAPPPPTYSVAYEVPSIVSLSVLVTLLNNPGIPSNALTLIQNAIVAAFAGADGGTRAGIGATVRAARYYGVVYRLGPWAQIVNIKIGVLAANLTASISGRVLTVTQVAGIGSYFGFGEAGDRTGFDQSPFYAEPIQVGQLIQDGPGLVASGTVITGRITGTGDVGTYQVSVSQTVASEAMTAWNLSDDVTLRIDQAPSVMASDVQLTLQ